MIKIHNSLSALMSLITASSFCWMLLCICPSNGPVSSMALSEPSDVSSLSLFLLSALRCFFSSFLCRLLNFLSSFSASFKSFSTAFSLSFNPFFWPRFTCISTCFALTFASIVVCAAGGGTFRSSGALYGCTLIKTRSRGLNGSELEDQHVLFARYTRRHTGSYGRCRHSSTYEQRYTITSNTVPVSLRISLII